jgi:hypothetical protein
VKLAVAYAAAIVIALVVVGFHNPLAAIGAVAGPFVLIWGLPKILG